jgi:hypothetical protein
VTLGAGRVPFRAADLLRLARLVQALDRASADPGDAERRP